MTIRQRLMKLESSRKPETPTGEGRRKLDAMLDAIRERQLAAGDVVEMTPEQRAAVVASLKARFAALKEQSA